MKKYVLGVLLVLMITGCTSSIEQTNQQAEVKQLPIPDNFHCFNDENKPECTSFYKNENYVCPKYFNPVCGTDRKFYPSQCWAEALGTIVSSKEMCPEMKQLFSDLWKTKSLNGKSYFVPSPNVEFTYSGSGIEGWKSGSWFRSTLWKSPLELEMLDLNIATTYGSLFVEKDKDYLVTISPVESTPKILLAFVKIDQAYPDKLLIELTTKYTKALNEYINIKQEVPKPIKYEINPVIISPPSSFSSYNRNAEFTEKQLQEVFDQASNGEKFDAFILSTIEIDGVGGYYIPDWYGMQFIHAPLTPHEAYSNKNKEQAINAISSFQQLFITISHEILHSTGLPGDHMPMGYGTYFLQSAGEEIDHESGRSLGERERCTFVATSKDHFGIELPKEITTKVEEEIFFREENPTGDCQNGLFENDIIKDIDLDGEYEIIYANNLIGAELQRSLGWVDIDGDGVAEIIDSTPYGGFLDISVKEDLEPTPLMAFKPIREVTHDNCVFQEVILTDGTNGLIPLECEEFKSDIVNVYQDLNYFWKMVQKPYGTILLARLGYN